jgi:hypothetical protein
MATIEVSPQKAAFKSPPNFSFPPIFASNNSIEEAGFKKPTGARDPTNFGLPSYPAPQIQNPTPPPTHPVEIWTPMEQSRPSPKRSALLTIPREIRLQIYEFVLLSHPIYHTHLSPLNDADKDDNFHKNMLISQGFSFPDLSSDAQITSISDSNSRDQGQEIRTSCRVKAKRGVKIQAKIPTGLLSSCRQIHYEVCLLPFQRSHFAFMNWMRSGVYVARNFTRRLRPWQSDAMRWTSVEVQAKDLWTGGWNIGKGIGEWKELCELWCGVWGLRLRIKGRVALEQARDANHTARESLEDTENADRSSQEDIVKKNAETTKLNGVLDVGTDWVVNGLLTMESLKWVELEIEDEHVERDVKLVFCWDLEAALNNMGNKVDRCDGEAKVVFVERIAEEVPREKFVWYGGQPGDDYE